MHPNEPGLPRPGPAANDPGTAALVMPGRRVRAGAGVDWIADGWRLFRKASLMWIVFLVLLFGVFVGVVIHGLGCLVVHCVRSFPRTVDEVVVLLRKPPDISRIDSVRPHPHLPEFGPVFPAEPLVTVDG